MAFTDLNQLINCFRDVDVFRLYFKPLAPNDNSKNQIYFGPDFQALNIFPNRGVVKDKHKLKAQVDFRWLDDTGGIHQAPTAQLILYPQYPEVRFSGFLRGCNAAPSELMTSREDGRVLFLGVTRDDKIIGYVVSASHPIAIAVANLTEFESVGVFSRVNLGEENQYTLLTKLKEIHLKGWILSKRLDSSGNEVACNAPNCGGYTLEAELGITPNGIPMPDYLGYEIKQFGVSDFVRMRAKSPLTLMTPEPTNGYYKDEGVEAFVRKYGYPDISGKPDRLNFGGVFRYGEMATRTGLTLGLTGYDPKKNTFDLATGGIVLLDDKDDYAAVWEFSSLMEHWSRKHAKTVYVPSLSQNIPTLQYQYGQNIFMGEGTDFLSFLKAVVNQDVYYDPGVKLEKASSQNPVIKRRSQFRIKVESLNILYHSWSEIDLLSGIW